MLQQRGLLKRRRNTTGVVLVPKPGMQEWHLRSGRTHAGNTEKATHRHLLCPRRTAENDLGSDYEEQTIPPARRCGRGR